MAKKLPLDVAKFKDLFVNRDDVYSVQGTDGNYYQKISRPLSNQAIKDHMLGKQTIGLYQLKNDKVKWAVIDIDINKDVWNTKNFKLEDWKEKVQTQAKIFVDILQGKGMKSYREESGFKGEHVWVFFNKPLSAGLVKNVFESLFSNMELINENLHIEIFPKQAHASDTGTGSLVKAPLGKHQRSKKFSSFIDNIEEVEFVTEETIIKAITGFDAIFHGCSALRNLRDEGIRSEHLGHEERLALAYIYGNLDKSGLDYIEKEVFSKLSDFDPEKTKYQLNRISDKNYKPVTCRTLQEKGICPGPCTFIGNGKSPITFYYRQKGVKMEDEELKATCRWGDLEMHGHSYYERRQGQPLPEQISNFVINLYEQVHIDNGIKERTIFRGHIINEDGAHDIEISADDYSKADSFSAAVYSVLGNSGTFIGNPAKIRDASNKFSNKNKVNIKKIFGYNDDHTKYYTPTIMVTSEGPKINDEAIISLEGEGQAESLDMKLLTDKEYEEVKKHIDEELLELADFETTHSVFAHAMLPIIEPFLDDDKSKFAFFVRGQSGTGKSFLLRAFQNFYGHFPEDVVTWGSTPFAIQRLGYFFKDCLYLVDDFTKKNIINMIATLQILQNYADTTARARLSSSGDHMGSSWIIKGDLAITGEDSISGEAASIARMITIEYSGRVRDFKRGEKIKKMRSMYNGFTPRYIHYILNQDKEEIFDLRGKYTQDFLQVVVGQANDIRIARNVALLLTSYDYLARFMWDKKKAEKNILRLKAYLSSVLKSVVAGASEEKSSVRFWQAMQDYIAAGKLKIAPDAGTYDQNNGAIIGFKSGGKTWLMHNVAYNEVQKLLKQSGDHLHHGLSAILHDLEVDEMIETSKGTPRTFNGKSVRAIPIEFDQPNLINND